MTRPKKRRQPVSSYRFGRHSLSFTRPLMMGIINTTPDSFSDGGAHLAPAQAAKQADHLIKTGASIIDIGGESSRPGAEPVTEAEEIQRVIPAIRHIASKHPQIPISIDSYKPAVVAAALEAGATIINDITGMRNAAMRQIAATSKSPVVIMHMQGEPQTMQQQPRYKDVVTDISAFFEERIDLCLQSGVTKIILDPGLGFGKTVRHNLEIIGRLPELCSQLNYPILIGASRKSFIGAILDATVDDRLEGDLAITAMAVQGGAKIIRTHEIISNHRAAIMGDAVRKGAAHLDLHL